MSAQLRPRYVRAPIIGVNGDEGVPGDPVPPHEHGHSGIWLCVLLFGAIALGALILSIFAASGLGSLGAALGAALTNATLAVECTDIAPGGQECGGAGGFTFVICLDRNSDGLCTPEIDQIFAEKQVCNGGTLEDPRLANVTRVGKDLIFTGINLHVRDGSGSTQITQKSCSVDASPCTDDFSCSELCVGGEDDELACERPDDCDSNVCSPQMCGGDSPTLSCDSTLAPGFAGDHCTTDEDCGGVEGACVGCGNIIVGYNEPNGSLTRTGAHNLVVGAKHTWTSHSGIVSGEHNSITGVGASVTGGRDNEASGDYSSVSGGRDNEASGDYSSVSGGRHGTASGAQSSVIGGGFTGSANGNTASGDYSVVGGGRQNVASGGRALVLGGVNNNAGGFDNAILGGLDNIISAGNTLNNVIVGGTDNTICTSGATFAAIFGGLDNDVCGDTSTIVGGRDGSLSGERSVLVGHISSSTGTSSDSGDSDTTFGTFATGTEAGSVCSGGEDDEECSGTNP